MTQLQVFEFNPIAENTYIVYDETGECAIFDPGCYTDGERAILKNFITENQLRPVRLINTHCHLDHIFGNRFVAETWELGLEIHRGELPVLERYLAASHMYGLMQAQPSPEPSAFLESGDVVTFGNTPARRAFHTGPLARQPFILLPRSRFCAGRRRAVFRRHRTA